MPQNLIVAAVALLDPAGRIFLVRKRGTQRWMQPGGKLEVGEDPLAAALRELREEMGVDWEPGRLMGHGTWEGAAANEPGAHLRAHLFLARWDERHDGVARVGAELAEGRWMSVDEALHRDDLAPLLRERVLPLVRAQNSTRAGSVQAAAGRR